MSYLFESSLIILLLGFIYLGIKNFNFAFYLLIALLPTYLIRFSVYNLPLTIWECLLVILTAIYLVKLIRSKALKTKLNLPLAIIWPTLLLIISATISLYFAPDLRTGLGWLKAFFLEPLIFLGLVSAVVKKENFWPRIIRALGFPVLAIAIFGIYQYITGEMIPNAFWANEATRRITTFFGYPNANALFVGPIICLTIANVWLSFKGGIKKNLGWFIFDSLVIIGGLAVIYWAKSSGAMIAIAGALLIALLFVKQIRPYLLGLILCGAIAVAVLPVTKDYLSKRIVEVSSTHLPLNASSLHMRVQQWRETIELLKTTPYFGSGLAGYQIAVIPFHQNSHVEIFLFPHNFFLNFYVHTGLLGLLAILWLVITAIVLWFKNYFSILKQPEAKVLNIVAGLALLEILIHGLVDVPYFKNDLAPLFLLVICLIGSLNFLATKSK
jgi:O-antigen ligase